MENDSIIDLDDESIRNLDYLTTRYSMFLKTSIDKTMAVKLALRDNVIYLQRQEQLETDYLITNNIKGN